MAERHQSVLEHAGELDEHDEDEHDHEDGPDGLQLEVFHVDVDDVHVLPNPTAPAESEYLETPVWRLASPGEPACWI